MNKEIEQKAMDVLAKNWQGGFTIPCQGLYPFQWNWDSGFIAIGWAHFDIAKAKREITTFLAAQWENGFLPHIVFHHEADTYFPGPDFHCAELHPKASKKYRTTGLTQPPVLGFVLKELYRIAKDKKDMLRFIKSSIDNVYNNHRYFYEQRDPHREGLVYIYHNWESGTDNSPMWDKIFETIDAPEYSFERRDTTHVDPAQRPSKREYDHYLYILNIAKKYRYNDEKIAQHSPFLVQDPLFNAVLIKSNEALIELYTLIGNEDEKIHILSKWQDRAKRRYNEKLFDSDLGAYIHYDLRAEKPIQMLSSSSFTALFANIPDTKRAAVLKKVLQSKFGGHGYYLCASFDPANVNFNPKKYWRGPVWINLNWILYYGLKNYGFNTLAENIKNDSIELVKKVGFYEYFDPRKEMYKSNAVGYGGNNFSWTAALLIDLLNT